MLYGSLIFIVTTTIVVVVVVFTMGDEVKQGIKTSITYDAYSNAITSGDSTLVTFKTIEEGYYSGISKGEQKVYEQSNDFEVFWSQHKMRQFPEPEVPEIDFRSEIVVAVFRGEQTTGGYGIQIQSILESESEVTVYSEVSVPSPGGMVTQAFSQPYHIVKIPKSTKSVQFEVYQAIPPPVYPRVFILSYDKKLEDPDQIAWKLKNMEVFPQVKDVTVLSNLRMLFVFYEEGTDPCTAKLTLLGLISSMEYVEYSEADPQEKYWDVDCEMTIGLNNGN